MPVRDSLVSKSGNPLGRLSGMFDDCVGNYVPGAWRGGGYAVLVHGETWAGDPIARLRTVVRHYGDAMAIAKALVKDDEAGFERAWVEEWQPDRESHSKVMLGWRRGIDGRVLRDYLAGPTVEELE